ncbi:putative HYDROLASE domain protein [Mycobacterium ulcerans str. Harvey]|uniref:HYDROLASE domain protein n=1 Tax=Mycobacterium ulcerans str. Harvey TaxID=1299332 RepID=A0ABN0QTK9_MYCUL|nr:putative HYDROLASE domain protein [Mycobacterium ulcerans str. Harvey]
MAYGAECATWRNFFLSGATELAAGNMGTLTQAASSASLLGNSRPSRCSTSWRSA